jgi:hypothetical protein
MKYMLGIPLTIATCDVYITRNLFIYLKDTYLGLPSSLSDETTDISFPCILSRVIQYQGSLYSQRLCLALWQNKARAEVLPACRFCLGYLGLAWTLVSLRTLMC